MANMNGFKHGVNLGGWLSQCVHTKEHYDTFITEDDIKVIKSWGLDHVRVPVDYDLVQNLDGSFKEDGFAYIQKAIDYEIHRNRRLCDLLERDWVLLPCHTEGITDHQIRNTRDSNNGTDC